MRSRMALQANCGAACTLYPTWFNYSIFTHLFEGRTKRIFKTCLFTRTRCGGASRTKRFWKDKAYRLGIFCSVELSLKRVWVWTRGPLFRLSVLLQILNQSNGKKGGEILSAIHAYVDHGDLTLQTYTTTLISAISAPFYKMISTWIYQGDLNDPYGEFFVTGGKGGEDVWGKKYSFNESMVPNFISTSLASKVYSLLKIGIHGGQVSQFCAPRNGRTFLFDPFDHS